MEKHFACPEFEWTLPKNSAQVIKGRDIKTAPALWCSSEYDEPPGIGARVRITFNQWGTGTVAGYFTEDGFLGLLVKPARVPEWARQQRWPGPYCTVFGPEIEGL